MKPDNAYQKFEFSRAFLERVSALILGARYAKKRMKAKQNFLFCGNVISGVSKQIVLLKIDIKCI